MININDINPTSNKFAYDALIMSYLMHKLNLICNKTTHS